MPEPRRLLLIEDSELDAELVQAELRRAAYECTMRRVDNARDLRDALERGRWDLAMCDHGLPGFASREALAIVNAHDPELPFVIMSGTNREEATVEALRACARDVILKSNLARVAPVIERVLLEAEGLLGRRASEEELARL